MSDRLTFFREQMAAFEGAANPQNAINSGYYIPEPGPTLAERIASRLSLRPASSHLLLGGIGSGKTTQLLAIRDRLNKEVADTSAYYVDISAYTDVLKIAPGALVAIVGLVLSELPQVTEQEQTSTSIRIIRNFAYGYKTTERVNSFDEAISSALGQRITKYHDGILKAEHITQRPQLLKAVSHLAELAKAEFGNLVFLFDGLDRLNDDNAFATVITEDLKDLSSFNVGSILVGPLSAVYSSHRETIEASVTSVNYQPFFDTDQNSDAQNFFQQVLAKRAAEDFLEESAEDALIHYSGGILRDLINLTQSAIEEAYLSGEDHLQEKHVLNAIDAFARSKLLGLSNEELEVLTKQLDGGSFFPTNDDELRLLATGRILEYREPEQHFVVHPALVSIIYSIREKQQVS